MAKVYLEDTILKNIANSIRNKNGETTTYKPSEMPTAIDNIETGGGGASSVSINNDYACYCAGLDNSQAQEKLNELVTILNNNPNILYNLTGLFGHFAQTSSSDLTTITIPQINNNNILDLSKLFYLCYNLVTINNLSNLNLENCIKMEGAFANNQSLPSLDFSNLNLNKVVDMADLCSGCSSLTSVDFSGIQANNLRIMRNMFYDDQQLQTINFTGFVAPNVEDLSSCFYYNSKLKSIDLSGVATNGNLKGMRYCFYRNSSLTEIIGINNLDISNVKNLSNAFYYCSSLTSLDLSSWDWRNITTLDSIFQNCSKLETLKLGENFSPKLSTISMFNNSCYQNMELTMGGNTNFSNKENAAVLNLSTIWRGTDDTKISLFETFANSLGTNNSGFTRQIKIYTNLYNALSDEQKALITDKGYTLVYGTS